MDPIKARTYAVVPAWRESYRTPGQMVRNGWHLILDDEWADTYQTKREAVAAGRYATAFARWAEEQPR